MFKKLKTQDSQYNWCTSLLRSINSINNNTNSDKPVGDWFARC